MISPTLLIIEDDHKMRRLLELILAEEGVGLGKFL